MARFTVTSDDLRDVSARLRAGAESIDGELMALRSRVSALVEGGWQGGASQSFHDLYFRLDRGAQQVREALAGLSTQLTSAAGAYENTEQNISADFTR